MVGKRFLAIPSSLRTSSMQHEDVLPKSFMSGWRSDADVTGNLRVLAILNPPRPAKDVMS